MLLALLQSLHLADSALSLRENLTTPSPSRQYNLTQHALSQSMHSPHSNGSSPQLLTVINR